MFVSILHLLGMVFLTVNEKCPLELSDWCAPAHVDLGALMLSLVHVYWVWC